MARYGQGDLEEAPELFDDSDPRKGLVMLDDTRPHSRKRKSSSSSPVGSSSGSSVSPDPSLGSMSSASAGRRRSVLSMPHKKTAHNMIEKRYRTNLNDKIAALRDSVPSLRVMMQRLEQQSSEDGDEEAEQEDLGGLAPAHKINKGAILSKAAEYIVHLERRNQNLAKENAALRSRVEGFARLVKDAEVGEEGRDDQDW